MDFVLFKASQMEKKVTTDAITYTAMEEKLFETPKEADLLIVYKRIKGKSKLLLIKKHYDFIVRCT